MSRTVKFTLQPKDYAKINDYQLKATLPLIPGLCSEKQKIQGFLIVDKSYANEPLEITVAGLHDLPKPATKPSSKDLTPDEEKILLAKLMKKYGLLDK